MSINGYLIGAVLIGILLVLIKWGAPVLTPVLVAGFLALMVALGLTGVLWLAVRLPGRGFGPVGFSILAALSHMSGQFTLAWLLFIPHPALWRLFPTLLTAALLFGIVSGIIAGAVVSGRTTCKT